jgi:hypothetical protein
MMDFGHCQAITFPLTQTGLRLGGFSSERATHAQFLTFTKPLDRQLSHFHAAGGENWKWNAIRSFFFRLPIIQSLGE